MNINSPSYNPKRIKRIIWLISIVIPLVVVALFQVKLPYSLPFLPYVNAIINSIALICILLAFYYIKKGNIKNHRILMTTALFLSVLFLISYLLYHAGSEESKYGGEGILRYIYFFLLISHILLSSVIVPLVLVTFLRARIGDFEKHKKIARITYPVWIYVLVSGILVFILIQPYY